MIGYTYRDSNSIISLVSLLTEKCPSKHTGG